MTTPWTLIPVMGVLALSLAFLPLTGSSGSSEAGTATGHLPTADGQGAGLGAGTAGTEATQEQLAVAATALRTSAGETPLPRDPNLDRGAQAWAEYLAGSGAFHHDDMECRAGSGCMSEIVAIVSGNPLDALDRWMESDGHRANLLGGGANAIGHGAVRMETGQWRGSWAVVQRFWND